MKTQQWKLWEEIDGCYIFPANADPDDMSFGRIKPVAKIMDSGDDTNVTTFVRYLAKLPEFNTPRKGVSRAMRLQREHEHQSNRDAQWKH